MPANVSAADRSRRLRQLERIFDITAIQRRPLPAAHPARGRNVLAGYLTRSMVGPGLIGYREIVLDKP